MLGSWRGLANQAPGLATFQVFQDKTNSIHIKRVAIWSQIDGDISLPPSWDYKQEPGTAIFEVSPTEQTNFLGPFSQWGLQICCAIGLPSVV